MSSDYEAWKRNVRKCILKIVYAYKPMSKLGSRKYKQIIAFTFVGQF